MKLTNEMMREFTKEVPVTDGDKLRLLLAHFVLINEKAHPAMEWRENEVVDDVLRIADKLDSQSGGVVPE